MANPSTYPDESFNSCVTSWNVQERPSQEPSFCVRSGVTMREPLLARSMSTFSAFARSLRTNPVGPNLLSRLQVLGTSLRAPETLNFTLQIRTTSSTSLLHFTSVAFHISLTSLLLEPMCSGRHWPG